MYERRWGQFDIGNKINTIFINISKIWLSICVVYLFSSKTAIDFKYLVIDNRFSVKSHPNFFYTTQFFPDFIAKYKIKS